METRYVARCHKRLKEWNAPFEGWYGAEVIDMAHDNNQCELCDCKRVRFIHVMDHEDYFESLHVGCVCAGIMEGDLLEAKERDNQARNRSKRKVNYLKKKWHLVGGCYWFLSYKRNVLGIMKNAGCYRVSINGKTSYHSATSFLKAQHLAFDLLEEEL